MRLPRKGAVLELMRCIDTAVSMAKDSGSNAGESIARYIPNKADEIGARKMLECAARKYEARFNILGARRTRANAPNQAAGTITVKRDKKVSYAELLRGMQASVDPHSLGVEIEGTTRSPDGDIRVWPRGPPGPRRVS